MAQQSAPLNLAAQGQSAPQQQQQPAQDGQNQVIQNPALLQALQLNYWNNFFRLLQAQPGDNGPPAAHLAAPAQQQPQGVPPQVQQAAHAQNVQQADSAQDCQGNPPQPQPAVVQQGDSRSPSPPPAIVMEDTQKIAPLRRLAPKDPASIEWKSAANKHRYEGHYATAMALATFQNNHLPDESPYASFADDFNKVAYSISKEMEDIVMAENSEWGWSMVRKLKQIDSRDPELTKRISQAEKELIAEQKASKKPAVEWKGGPQSQRKSRPPKSAAAGGRAFGNSRGNAMAPPGQYQQQYAPPMVPQQPLFQPFQQPPPPNFMGMNNRPNFGAQGFYGYNPPPQNSYSGPPQCYTCNGIGHKAPDCPSGKPSTSGRPPLFWESAASKVGSNPPLENLLHRAKISVLRGKAPSTVKAYSAGARKFENFCLKNQLVSTPADPLSVVLFLQTLIDESASVSAVNQIMAGISWKHQTEGAVDPTKSPLVGNLVSAVKRNETKPVKHAEIALKAHALHLAKVYSSKKDLVSLRLLALSVTLFAGCLRLDDIVGLQRQHFSLHADHVEIFLPRNKTDQFRLGNLKFIPAGKNPEICPLRLLVKWLRVGVATEKEAPAFPMITNKQKQVAKSTLRANLAEALASSPLPKITFHSFRAGFATEAINKGADSSAVQAFGLWKTCESMQRYTKRDKNHILETGKLLGL